MKARRLEVDASPRVLSALSVVGRTEDIRFSPNNRLLAIAGFGRNRLLLLSIDVSVGSRIKLDDFMELTSDSIGAVHGVDFIDDKTIVVANRDGIVAIFVLPEGELAGRSCSVAPIRRLDRGIYFKMRSPGSVAVRKRSNGLVSLYVCHNYSDRVSHHVIAPSAGYVQCWSSLAMKRGLKIPDGVAVSANQRWIAVSSHLTNDVKIYAADRLLGSKTMPVGVLSGMAYPHGLRFTADDRHIVVADAGRPALYVYSSDGDWRGERPPAHEANVMDETSFDQRNVSEDEGGPKGLDIDRLGSVVAVTCETEPLAFYAMSTVVGSRLADK